MNEISLDRIVAETVISQRVPLLTRNEVEDLAFALEDASRAARRHANENGGATREWPVGWLPSVAWKSYTGTGAKGERSSA